MEIRITSRRDVSFWRSQSAELSMRLKIFEKGQSIIGTMQDHVYFQQIRMAGTVTQQN